MKKTILLIIMLFMSLIIIINGKFNVSAKALDYAIASEELDEESFSVYTYNCPGIQDWRHDFVPEKINHYVEKVITSWTLKDYHNPVVLNYSTSISGTISSTLTTTSSTKVDAKLQIKVFEGGVEQDYSVSQSISYSYTKEDLKAYTFTITPDRPGKYFAICLNYAAKQYTVKHYHQKFKLFGQGEYVHKLTSTVEMPIMEYISLDYKYSTNGKVTCDLSN